MEIYTIIQKMATTKKYEDRSELKGKLLEYDYRITEHTALLIMEIIKDWERDISHQIADHVLCCMVSFKVREAFQSIDKWYS